MPTQRSPYDQVANVYNAFWSLLPAEAMFNPQFRAIADALLLSFGWTADDFSWEASERLDACNEAEEKAN